jgi:hypothetical protein
MILMDGTRLKLLCMYLRWVICVALILSAQGCGKSAKSGSDEKQAVKQHVRQLNQQILNSPDTVATFAAMRFLSKLKKEGQLPGVPKDEHGMIRHEKKNQMGGPCYSSVELHYFSTNIPPRNCYYVVTQVSSNGPPQLEKAWSVDQNGNLHQYDVQ